MSLFLQVLGFALILLYVFNVAMPLWRIHQGMPQAPELLIHPTVWLTTMVTTACAEAWLALNWALLLVWGVRGRWEPPPLPSTLSCLDICHLPDSHGEEEGRPGVWGAVRVLAALLSLARDQRCPAGLYRGERRPGELYMVVSDLSPAPFHT